MFTSEFWSGIVGVIIGGGMTLAGQWLRHRWDTSAARRRDAKRRALLEDMLNNPGPNGWRKISTMSAVIGTNEDETARLLIEVGARASETGSGAWAFVKNKPLPAPDADD